MNKLIIFKFQKYNKLIKYAFLHNKIIVKGPLGILEKNIINNSNEFLYYLFKFNSLSLFNNMIISNKLLRVLFNILNKMVIGVLYGWYFCLNIVGRGFTFKIKKKNGINFLKLKIGYSHFLYYKLNPNIMLKISKKKNKLFLFCLDFWLLSKFVYQIRNLRSKHTYKLQGIHFFNEKIVVKPGKKKQV